LQADSETELRGVKAHRAKDRQPEQCKDTGNTVHGRGQTKGGRGMVNLRKPEMNTKEGDDTIEDSKSGRLPEGEKRD